MLWQITTTVINVYANKYACPIAKVYKLAWPIIPCLHIYETSHDQYPNDSVRGDKVSICKVNKFEEESEKGGKGEAEKHTLKDVVCC